MGWKWVPEDDDRLVVTAGFFCLLNSSVGDTLLRNLKFENPVGKVLKVESLHEIGLSCVAQLKEFQADGTVPKIPFISGNEFYGKFEVTGDLETHKVTIAIRQWKQKEY